MDESIKSRIILILGVLSIIFFVGMLHSCGNEHKIKLARDKEMVTRLDAEEKTAKAAQEKLVFEDKLKKVSQELEEEKTANQATKKALLQEQLVNQSLQEEIQKITKLKEVLEKDLKEALSASGGAKPSKAVK